METKELKIQIPEGYCIDESKSTFEKIAFKKKDTKPRSWKEYLKLNTGFDGSGIDWNMDGGIQTSELHHRGKAIVPTHLAQPFIAMMQLMSLRQEWIGDWKTDWNTQEYKYCIKLYDNTIFIVVDARHYHQALSFPTLEMATDFMNTFKDLLNVARSLI